jgi:hypothetical protein
VGEPDHVVRRRRLDIRDTAARILRIYRASLSAM